jgi:hypothetical protein
MHMAVDYAWKNKPSLRVHHLVRLKIRLKGDGDDFPRFHGYGSLYKLSSWK